MISEGENDETIATKLDFDYAYGETKPHENIRNKCIFTVTGRAFGGHNPSLENCSGLAHISTIFQERIVKTLGHKHPVFLDDIIIVTKRGMKECE